jgi:ABC-type lipoprotein release transport system permease subunit
VFWVMVLTVSGTLYAAWRAARIAPVEALRHD